MIIRLVSYELSGTDFTESNARPVVGIDVRCNLKDEACKLGILWHYCLFFGLGRLGTGCDFDETVEQFLNTEVV